MSSLATTDDSHDLLGRASAPVALQIGAYLRRSPHSQASSTCVLQHRLVVRGAFKIGKEEPVTGTRFDLAHFAGLPACDCGVVIAIKLTIAPSRLPRTFIPTIQIESAACAIWSSDPDLCRDRDRSRGARDVRPDLFALALGEVHGREHAVSKFVVDRRKLHVVVRHRRIASRCRALRHIG